MRKNIVKILSLLSLFCVFAQMVEPFFIEKEHTFMITDVDNEADDDQEKKEKSLEDKEKEAKLFARYKALAGIEKLIHAIPFKSEGKTIRPYLGIFSPPPDVA